MTSKSALIVTVLAVALLASVTSAAQSGESLRSCQPSCNSDVNESTTFKSYCIPDQLLSIQQVVKSSATCRAVHYYSLKIAASDFTVRAGTRSAPRRLLDDSCTETLATWDICDSQSSCCPDSTVCDAYHSLMVCVPTYLAALGPAPSGMSTGIPLHPSISPSIQPSIPPSISAGAEPATHIMTIILYRTSAGIDFHQYQLPCGPPHATHLHACAYLCSSEISST